MKMTHLFQTSIISASQWFGLLCLTTSALGADILVPAGSIWKYLDNGSDQGTAWRTAGFNDGGWAAGPAQLGYGDGDEATTVSYGPSSSAKFTTTYFRLVFNVANPASYSGLTVNLLRDDGAVVYLNGQEVCRNNLPTGTISYTTLATTALGAPEEATFYANNVAATNLVAGNNILAVEVHQANGTSTDLSFDLELSASTGPTLTRGPYLQQGTPTSVIVRWRTDSATDSRVRFGTGLASLTLTADDPTVTTEHAVTVSGLTPDTKYYYAVGNIGGLSASDPNFFFTTAPAPGAIKPTRIWVLGDSGTANASAASVRDSYLTYTGTRATDLLLMLGDNAYENGLDSEYQAAVFNMYPTVLESTVVWPTLGNHDTAQSTAFNDTYPYFSIFNLPKNGEAGGLASGSEHYYSFDYANIHFICLDSMTASRATNGAMANWLRSDLADTTREWIIAFWHHPPYTKGSHNSDTESQLIQMRQNFLPILEANGVDLVLCGHSHSYERSYLLDSHYGLSSTLTQGMKLDGGDGREDGAGAYHKPEGLSTNQGAVYAVAGSSGKISGGTLNHPAMFVSVNVLGSMVLDLNGNRLDAVFLNASGVTQDHFTIIKTPASPTLPAPPTGLTATAVSSSAINLAWTDASANEDGFKVERSTDGLNFLPLATVGANVVNGADTGLNPSTTYYYRVRAFNAAGDSAFSAVASAMTFDVPPSAPTGLTATAGVGQVNLSWNAAAGATSYRVQRAGLSGGPYATLAAGVTLTSYTDLSGVNGTTYFYVVSAINASGESANSNEASAAPQPPPPPSAPTGLTATAVSSSQINLAWTDTATTETGFQIERSADGVNFAQIATVGANVTSYSSTGLSPATTYHYRVRASSGSGDSAFSNPANATTLAAPPAAPGNLTATAISKSQINLAWTDNSGNEQGFKIERSTNGSTYTQIATVGANVLSYQSTGLTANKLYYYRVRAYSAAGNSPYSNTASARTLRK